jgi:predicted nicotinamide N-methyase
MHLGPRAMAKLTGLPPIPGGWTTEEVEVAGRAFRLTRPADPDAFLDDPEVHEKNRKSGYMPYWSYLWPGALPMARLVLQGDWAPATRALEIGSGIGLVGLAGLAAGLKVTFSDYDAQSLQLALHNAAQNNLAGAQGLLFDWRDPPEQKFPVVLGCEVIYEAGLHDLVLGVLDRMLAEGGVCWIGDPGRQYAPGFFAKASARGYDVEIRDRDFALLPLGDGRPDLPIGQFRLQILRRRA